MGLLRAFSRKPTAAERRSSTALPKSLARFEAAPRPRRSNYCTWVNRRRLGRGLAGGIGRDDHCRPHDPEPARDDYKELIMPRIDSMNLDKSAAATFLKQGVAGLGLVGLNSLLAPGPPAEPTAADLKSLGAINPLHFPAKAKRVIFLYQAGGPSHLETFDYKPNLLEMDGQGMPESFTKGQQIAQLQGKELKCFGPQYGFKKFGKSGRRSASCFRTSAAWPTICIIRSMWSEQINHDPAHTLMNTGSIIAGRPSMGRGCFTAWDRRPRICPGSWCCCRPAEAARCSRSRRGNGRPDFCRASFRA